MLIKETGMGTISTGRKMEIFRVEEKSLKKCTLFREVINKLFTKCG